MRAARPDDAELLTAIAHEAKRHWGYPASWLAGWREALTVGRAYIAQHQVWTGEIGGQVVGFYALEEETRHWSLAHLWVRPAYHGRRIGERLFRHAVERVRSVRPGPLLIESDPHAEGFYLRLGARRVGSLRADVGAVRRTLPVLRLDLGGP